MDETVIEYEVDDRTAWITIDRPEKLNALTRAAMVEFEAAFEEAQADEEVRVVVLEGTDKAFSVGYDIGTDAADGDDRSLGETLAQMGSYTLVPTIYELEMPVIAAVDGYALGGGCNLALGCDLTIATERSSFGYVDVRMGGLPGQFLHPFIMGSMKHARELFYTGKMISGTEAAQMGLVNRAVPAADLESEVREEIAAIRTTPEAVVTLTKGLCNEAMERRGYRPRGQVSEAYATLSVQSEWYDQFTEIRDSEGMEAAIEWMHEEQKP